MHKTKHTKQEYTSIRIEELKEFLRSGKKAIIYEPNPRFFKVYGYLRTPDGLQEALRYAIEVEGLPIIVHKFRNVIVLIRTDI